MHTHVKKKLYEEGPKTRFAVGILVLALHGVLIYALWRAHPGTMPEPTPVFVRLLDAPPSVPVKERPPSAPPTLQKQHDSPHAAAPLVVRTDVVARTEVPGAAPIEPVAPSAIITTGPVVLAPSAPLQLVTPIGVASDLSLSCPIRSAPVYPTLARKMGETGSVLLRVELDETGRLVSAEVSRSSGFLRLDQAALAAVKNWRCNPAMREGQAVRVVSMESFDFKLKPDGSESGP